MLSELLPIQLNTKFVLPTPNKKLFGEDDININAHQIYYCQAKGAYCIITYYVEDNKLTQLFSHPLAHYEKLLMPVGFLRSNKSYLINLLQVKHISHKNQAIIMQNDFEMEYSDLYKPLFLAAFPKL